MSYFYYSRDHSGKPRPCITAEDPRSRKNDGLRSRVLDKSITKLTPAQATLTLQELTEIFPLKEEVE